MATTEKKSYLVLVPIKLAISNWQDCMGPMLAIKPSGGRGTVCGEDDHRREPAVALSQLIGHCQRLLSCYGGDRPWWPGAGWRGAGAPGACLPIVGVLVQ